MPSVRCPFVVLALVIPVATRAQAFDAATLSYAYGATWNAPEAHRDMLIFEYFNAWRFGDDYIYFETQNLATRRDVGSTAGSGETTPYGEAHARLDVGNLFGNRLLGAVQVDASQGDMVLLTGTGITWRAGGRTLFNTDVFLRYDPSLAGATWQAVAYGEWGFHIGQARLSYGGYIKFVGAEHPQPAFMVSDTRLLWHPAEHIGVGLAVRAGYQGAVPEAVLQWRF